MTPMLSKDVACFRHSKRMAGLTGSAGYSFANLGTIWSMATRRSGSRYAGGRSSTPSTREKMAVLAPIPTARLSTTMAAKARSRKRARMA